MNVGHSIVQWNNIDPLQMEMGDAGIGTGNGSEEVAPNLDGHPVMNAPEKWGEKQDNRCALTANATSNSIVLPPHVSNLATFIS